MLPSGQPVQIRLRQRADLRRVVLENFVDFIQIQRLRGRRVMERPDQCLAGFDVLSCRKGGQEQADVDGAG